MGITIDGKEYYGIIYKIENTITHHIYIGQTTHPRGFDGRYSYEGTGIEKVYRQLANKRDRKERHNQYLLRSIEKCGFDAFVIDKVFDVASTIDELNEKEAYYIKKFDSYKNGYNMSFGGDGISGYERPKGKECKNSKRVCQIGLDGELIKIWDCATDVERELCINQTSICDVCSGRNKTAGGFVWVHEKDYDPNQNYKRIPQIKDRGKGANPVLLLSENNDILKEFYSINNASAELGMSVEGVRKICKHKIKNPRYNLIYKSEYMGEQRLSVREPYEEAS